MKTLIAFSLFVLSTHAFASGTCVSPGPCPDFDYEITHTKVISCGPWADLPQRFVFKVEVPLGVVPLAGEAGVSQAQQCEDLLDALTGQ